MNNIIERAARQMYEGTNETARWSGKSGSFGGLSFSKTATGQEYESLREEVKSVLRENARAAFMALRDLPDDIIQHGVRAQIDYESSPYEIGVPSHKPLAGRGRAFFQGIIDAILHNDGKI